MAERTPATKDELWETKRLLSIKRNALNGRRAKYEGYVAEVEALEAKVSELEASEGK